MPLHAPPLGQPKPSSRANNERLRAELDLLQAMYPDSVTFNSRPSELSFYPESTGSAKLVLRLPDTYPEHGSPDVVLATGSDRVDLRQELKKACNDLTGDGEEGAGEVLDAIISTFIDLTDQAPNSSNTAADCKHQIPATSQPSKTVIIWLHHLLATSKRKLALHPSTSPSSPSASNLISGITKPGYPGILLFTGPKGLVDEHVRELKGQNWQAFSVRYEEDGNEDEEWIIGGRKGGGIKEVESMAELVKVIEEGKKEVFLRAVGVK